MKITKYAQSCTLVETNGKRILIDPGYLKYEESLLNEAWLNMDAVLITHRHKDHIFDEALSQILKGGGKLYSSKEVADEYQNLNFEIVKAGDTIKVGEIKVEVVRAVHGYLPSFKERGIVIDENIGYIVDDGETRFYNTSDCISFNNDYHCDVVALPVSGHGICFSPYDGAEFANALGAKLVIPIHYDNPVHPLDMDEFKREMDERKLKYKILSIGESTEINLSTLK